MVIRDACPQCGSSKCKKNGHIHNGKQNHHCHDCGRQFGQYFAQYLIADDKRELIERLLLERISLRGICRAVGVGLKWLLGFLAHCVEALPDHLHIQPATCHGNVMIRRLEVEADEMSSFVQKKTHKQWIWIAMDAKTRQVIAFYVGDRSRKSAKRLWAKIPLAYRHHATFYTDQYVVYEGVIPAAQHRAISKLARQTNHIERFNNTLRQRVSRLVREALSFSKKLANHIGAIKLFICHYNLTKAPALHGVHYPLLSLYSIITLTAHQLLQKEATIVRVTAWYTKIRPTFADAMALVRRHLWDHLHFSTSQQETDMIQIPRVLFDRFIDVVCYAA